MADSSTTVQKVSAEALGTFVLVFFGCGSVVYAGNGFQSFDIVAVGLTFGLAVMFMAYAVGRISGGHFNPAVTVGAAMGGRMSWKQVPIYVGSQLAGAIVAGLALFVLLQGYDGFEAEGSMGQNSFGDEGSGYAWWAAFLLELIMTLLFILVILAVTDARFEHPALAPLAIGLTLTAIHFVAIPATGTSVNPARSIGPGIFAGTDAIIQLWLFILAPLLGGALGGFLYPLLFGHGTDPVPGSGLNLVPARAGRGARLRRARPVPAGVEPAADRPGPGRVGAGADHPGRLAVGPRRSGVEAPRAVAGAGTAGPGRPGRAHRLRHRPPARQPTPPQATPPQPTPPAQQPPQSDPGTETTQLRPPE